MSLRRLFEGEIFFKPVACSLGKVGMNIFTKWNKRQERFLYVLCCNIPKYKCEFAGNIGIGFYFYYINAVVFGKVEVV